jgi:endonuclease YncB( thermonuclease family)
MTSATRWAYRLFQEPRRQWRRYLQFERPRYERHGKPYCCGKQVTKILADLIAGQTVQCEIVERDDFGRALCICSAGGTELNSTLMREGWTLAFAKYSE